ncbi:hypothetical protein DTO006G1_5376 [Penicillium roqueforti]|nr:hypothetical protein CBS147372_3745 [Penicillium roqueforti]KAI2759963.1 hypothetical protein DTO006G1_5376 [Penicillium roqueforti]KAI3147252.1 hypothetical protein CBS147317_8925 [Penicillium roqueforti]KAI3192491.1 hypothetical protein CBS147311_9157 [Penicillium roqueforti]KAI3246761.1 hypothetical protein CBS147309_8978 [Penicillium roqueforti]
MEEVLKDTPSPVNGMEVKSELEDHTNRPSKLTNVEAHIQGEPPNQKLITTYFCPKKALKQDDPVPENFPKEPDEESLDKTGSNQVSNDEESSGDEENCSDEEFKLASDEESLVDSEPEPAESSRNDSDLECSSRPVKKEISSKPKGKEQELISTSSSFIEKVKGLMHSNILSGAKANANIQQLTPVSQQKNKTTALAEEVAKLSIEDQPQAKKDANSLIQDSRKFEPSASIINMNWKVRGLKTLLKHHQLKAAAWMRNRESSAVEPNGGLLCDEMGLGKTLTALANIANEKFSNRSKAPTLIIVPRSLIAQWIDQISTHCEERVSRDVLEYYAGARTSESDVVRAMQKRLIVITTYEQVCSSHPKLKPPVMIKSPEKLEAWREKEYYRRAGPFHKVEWHRIILDEAHLIKNKDSATSIAVRALKGKFKWAMSGTPLHNGVEELYPYLHFIFTSERMGYDTFLKKYSKGLDNILETVLHRSTYSTWILGKPIITLPGINNRVVEVELCPAEKFLYREIQDLGIAMVNGSADTRQKQSKCILAVITMLRMFVSHPLLAQKFLETVLNQNVIAKLKKMVQAEGVVKSASGVIINLILGMGDKVAPRPRPPGDFSDLQVKFYEHVERVRENEGKHYQVICRICPHCTNSVNEKEAFVVTSCHHLYCKGCFDALPDQSGNTDTATRICSSCKKPIKEAGYSDDSPKGSPKKRKQSVRKGNGRNIFKKRRQKSFKQQVLLKNPSDREWDEPSEDESDWISCIGDRMPSAKTTAVRKLITDWVQEDGNAKIVIFAQFLKTIQLLQFMCEEEGWKYATITGKVSPTSRDRQIEQFSKEKDIKIMISSLKTGGVGLNLTMANKCILVDPWWNEAIQDQAYCRLYRIGQPRLVEYVQIVAKGSIDSWMIGLQKEKTRNIHRMFSTESLKQILGPSGDIREGPNGAFSIFTSKGNKNVHTWTQAVESGIIEEVNSSEDG